jgi:hypothetical protein
MQEILTAAVCMILLVQFVPCGLAMHTHWQKLLALRTAEPQARNMLQRRVATTSKLPLVKLAPFFIFKNQN